MEHNDLVGKKKKFEFKLSEEMPGQHVAILVVAGAFIFLSLVEHFKAPGEKGPTLDQVKGPYALTGETIYRNPQLAWYERLLCRGYQRSGFCSHKTLHPFRDVWEANGIRVRESRPERKGAIRYRGRLGGNRAIHEKMTLNELNK